MKYLTALCSVGNEDPRYIDEWREHHSRLGVESFAWAVHRVIDNLDFGTRYGERAVRVPVNYRGGHAEEVRCIKVWHELIKSCCDTRWLMLFDNDEFAVSELPLPSLLSEYEHADALAINWLMFGTSGHRTKQFPQTSAYTWRTRADHGDGGYTNGGNWHVKSIVNPQAVVNVPGDPHYLGVRTVNEHHNPVTGPFSRFSGQRIRINHYWTRSYEDWKEKQQYSVANRSMAKFYEFEDKCVVNDSCPMELCGYPELEGT